MSEPDDSIRKHANQCLNPPAFPDETRSGMTLLDWFAGQALIAMLSNPRVKDLTGLELSGAAYDLASDMLAERKKRMEK